MLRTYIKYSILLLRNSEHQSYQTYRNFSSSEGLKILHNECANEMTHLKRTVPLNADEFRNLKSLKPSQPENPRFLKVSILGEPNVGKSTLTNRLVKWRVCAVSSKVHTTRKRAKAILNEGNTQIVFLDTPGFVTPEKTKRHSLEPSFVMDPLRSIREANILAVVVDISDKWTNNRINPEILKILYDFREKKSILILNKIDAMKSKNRLLSLTRILTFAEIQEKGNTDTKELSENEIVNKTNRILSSEKILEPDFYENIEQKRGWPLFSKVFMVSALKNDGVDDLRDYLLSEAVSKDWAFNKGIVTDQHPHDIALMTVRENLLEYLPNEIPYKLNLKITKWEMLSTGCPKIDIQIACPNSRHRVTGNTKTGLLEGMKPNLKKNCRIERFVIGPNGKFIAACVSKCKKAMRESFRRDVVLKLAVV